MEDSLREILQEAEKHRQTGNRKALTAILRRVTTNRRAYYRESIAEKLEEEFADALYKVLLLEMDEEEEDSIEIAELAYLSLCASFHHPESVTAEHYKRRLLLLHYFCDYFTDSIIEVFLSKYRTDNMLLARNLALECLEKMQLSDMFYLEDHAPDFLDGDEQLSDACNAIETNPNLSDAEREEALLLHRVLYAYLKAKYKN